ncbi:hypothetical protein HJFPF1_07911 [Paramyrothecium foliicola]|nr:hypothetical protein HJFPF1_07911 [Paramyrothecium foliicola]
MYLDDIPATARLPDENAPLRRLLYSAFCHGVMPRIVVTSLQIRLAACLITKSPTFPVESPLPRTITVTTVPFPWCLIICYIIFALDAASSWTPTHSVRDANDHLAAQQLNTECAPVRNIAPEEDLSPRHEALETKLKTCALDVPFAHATTRDEESSASVETDDDDDLDRPPRQKSQRLAPSTSQSSSRRTRNGSQKNTNLPKADSSTVASPAGKRRKLMTEEDQHPPTEYIPDWRDPRIPYDAWATIFLFAGAYGTDTSWLIHAATTCHAFLEPALAAIYRSPQPRTPAKARRLVALLERPPSETLINYRTKVESLYIDVQIIPQTILFQMIYPLICLKELVIFTTLDHPPYRNLDKALRWHYPAGVFRALARDVVDTAVDDENLPPVVLRSWEWSGRLLGGHVPKIEDIIQLHQTPVFSQLTRVSFTNFQVPSLHKPQPKDGDEEAAARLYEEDGAVIAAVGAAISKLECLQHLVFESSTVMNDRLLPLLPQSLLHLELINCWEIWSEDLATFLQTHGSKMRILTLMHNQSLNLAFLTDLSSTCPKLEELRMSMSYFRHHDSLNDSDPMYDYALLPEQVPSWPPTIRVIDLEHVRDWSVETAEMFLQTLIDNAQNLPNLRHLALKTMLNIPWQSRATMRSEWKSRMEKVFLRPIEPPSNVVAPQESDEPGSARKKSRRKRSLTPSRRSGRIAAHEAEAADQAPRASKHRSQSYGRSFYREPDTDEDFDESEPSETEQVEQGAQSTNQDPELPVQGLCKIVNISFDNQKPREVQYGMEDFLTDNQESDEEWDHDEEEDDDAVVF